MVSFNKAVIAVKRMIVNFLLLRDSLPNLGIIEIPWYLFPFFSAALLLNLSVLIKVFSIKLKKKDKK